MLPLIRMNWVMNRRLLLQLLPLWGFYLWMGVRAQAQGAEDLVISTSLLIATLATLIVTLQGLLLPWEGFLLACPVSRAQVVQAKYATCWLALILGSALTPATLLLGHLVAPRLLPHLPGDLLAITALAALALGTGLAIFLPFIYRWGSTRGIQAFASLLVVGIGSALIWRGFEGSLAMVVNGASHLLAHPRLAWGAGAAVLGLTWGSLQLSIHSHERRAF